MATKKYKLTAKHRKELKPWADKWIENALSTKPMSPEDKATCIDAVNRLYDAAGKARPKTITFASSPFAARFAAGAAAAAWYLRKNGKEDFGSVWDAARADTRTDTAQVARDSADNATMEAAEPDTTGEVWSEVVNKGAASTSQITGAQIDALREATNSVVSDAAVKHARTAASAATTAAVQNGSAHETWDAVSTRETHAVMDSATAQNQAVREVTHNAVMAATQAATENAARARTRDATIIAVDVESRGATWMETWNATRDATEDATYAATEDATEDAAWDATRASAVAKATSADLESATDAHAINDVRLATLIAVSESTWRTVRNKVGDTVDIAAREVTDGATWDGVRDAAKEVSNAVVNDAVRDSVSTGILRPTEDAVTPETRTEVWRELRLPAETAVSASTHLSTMSGVNAAVHAASHDAETFLDRNAATSSETAAQTQITAMSKPNSDIAKSATGEARAEVSSVVSSDTNIATEAATDIATQDATDDAAVEAAAVEAAVDAATQSNANADTSMFSRVIPEIDTGFGVEKETRRTVHQEVGNKTWQAINSSTVVESLAATNDAADAAVMDSDCAIQNPKPPTWVKSNQWYHPCVQGCADAIRSLPFAKFALKCVESINRCWQGGNQWSGYDAYVSFFRHVAKLKIDYAKWDAWETLSLHSSVRFVHEDFCIISDRPEILLRDEQARPHCETGPFCKWRDGTALYAIHGVRVPWWVVEHPDAITVADIDAEPNAEVRRVMVDRYGRDRFMKDCGAEVLHTDDYGVLLRRNMGDDEPIVMVKVVNSTAEPDGTFKDYYLRVHPELRPMLPEGGFGEPQELTAHNAVASTFGKYGDEYAPEIET